MHRSLLFTAVLGLSTFGLAVPSATADVPTDDRFTCEATSARVKTPLVDAESTVANRGGDPCEDDFAQALGASIPGLPNPPVVTADVLTAMTDADPDFDGDETPDPGAKSNASATVVQVFLGTTTITVNVLAAEATASCDGFHPALAGNSQVVGLFVNGEGGSFSEEVKITDPANPLLNIWLNEQTREDTDGDGTEDKLTQRALHIFGVQSNGFLVDIVVGEAIADFQGNPCVDDH
jgi:hypothetical protein